MVDFAALNPPYWLVGDEIRHIFVRRGNKFILKYLTW